jgi:prephenate dehydrogenase
MPDDFVPFDTIAIVGLGLIGGSVALGVRERWPSTRVIGVDTPAVLAHALGSGAIDRAIGTLGEMGSADLVVLAAPVRENVELLGQLARRPQPIPLITDVGGTKREIVAASRALQDGSAFVGGHPLGGAEHGGFGFARPDLFKGRPWIFTPDGAGAGPAVGRLFGFAKGLGARPSSLTADAHDHLMAFVSHLPQLTASALMATVGGSASAEGLRLSGRGLIDTTRLASSPASVWRDVCATNSDAIGEALDALIERLRDLRADLTRGESLDKTFDAAARWRAELLNGRDP